MRMNKLPPIKLQVVRRAYCSMGYNDIVKDQKFNPFKPFADEKCFKDFLSAFTDFRYKLYGKLKFKLVYRDALEFDLHTKDVHYTEKDLKALTKRVAARNKKWKTNITYCLFPSRKFPVSVLINVRSPKAKFSGDF